jgi:hypothetical protein
LGTAHSMSSSTVSSMKTSGKGSMRGIRALRANGAVGGGAGTACDAVGSGGGHSERVTSHTLAARSDVLLAAANNALRRCGCNVLPTALSIVMKSLKEEQPTAARGWALLEITAGFGPDWAELVQNSQGP